MKQLVPSRGFKGIDQQAMSEYAATYIPLENHQTWTGLATTAESALNVITVYQCVRVLAETVASLPLIVYRRLPGGGKERATDHPWYDVLHGRPNENMTSFVWRELLMSHLATWGNGYNEITTDPFDHHQLWPLRPDRMVPLYDADGRKAYDYIQSNGQKKRMAPGTVFHVPGLSSTGLEGYSPIALMRSTIGLLKTAETYGTNFLRNGARPATVLEHPKLLNPAAVARLGAQMDELRGAGNSGKTVVLEEGLTVKEIGIPPEDAQYMETRLFQKREIAAAYRVPLHKLGDLERATFSNIEHQSLEFITDTMVPWLARIEQQINVDLIGGDQYFAEFLVDGYLRGDAKARAEAFAIRWQHGTVNADDWRAAENENPLPDGMGEEYFVPANYVPIAKALAADTEVGVPSDLMGVTAPQLVSVKGWGEFHCPDCGKLVNRKAKPGSVGFCVKCKAEKTMAGETEPDPFVDLIAAQARGNDRIVDALTGLAQAEAGRTIKVDATTQPPVTIEAAPPPNVVIDTTEFAGALTKLAAEIAQQRDLASQPKRRQIERDADGRMVAITEWQETA